MAAGTFNLTGDYEISAGDAFDVILPLTNGGTPLSFTGFTVARLKFRTGVDDTASFLTLAYQTNANALLKNSGIAIGADVLLAAGSIRITISDVDTTLLSYDVGGGAPFTSQRTGFYDVELVNANVVWRVLQGEFSVSPEVTR